MFSATCYATIGWIAHDPSTLKWLYKLVVANSQYTTMSKEMKRGVATGSLTYVYVAADLQFTESGALKDIFCILYLSIFKISCKI